VRGETAESRRRLLERVQALIAAEYRREMTLVTAARALASSPRQIQRAYEQVGETSFREDLRTRRLQVGAELLAGQAALRVEDIARLAGYSHVANFGRAFRERYGRSPGAFRNLARGAPAIADPAALSASDARREHRS
jgi:AraC family transcriptional regulator, regulatory protein of adaptative response / methylphosphotriester-DNA alkyltransferase methyltransferase